ncbi:MAG: hypothetical protein ACP5IZ_10535 [Thermoprotei archaeon]
MVRPPEKYRGFISKYVGDIMEWSEWRKRAMEFFNVDEKKADEMLIELMKKGFLKRTMEPGIKYLMRFPFPIELELLMNSLRTKRLR